MKFKTFFFKFTAPEVNSGRASSGDSFTDRIDKEINGWLQRNPGIQLLEFNQQHAEYNAYLIVQISIFYKNAA